ncbi:DMT family transporter [Microbacterium laevaniformans]|uniref:DMT family transporter n=1 Tax=Microbacterium laevaniformans TaxID=36807 RepID=UPI00195E112C|nr:DMT family transporter [Microbacterium laevaniformans]MBM7751961.1 drug/metabolite transporter (DMT)-like permease [Microbacterium laevaniformans]GLJ65133.1 transporter [Microbacterium laevaniformans]
MTRSPAPTPVRPGPSSAAIAVQFVLMGIIWGSSFLFMKVALGGISPAQVAWGRLVLGAATLGVFVLIRRDRLPGLGRENARVWGHMTVLAVSFCVVPFLLFSWAEQHVSSGLGSIYNATTPIMTAIMAALVFRVERLKPVQIAGIALGIGGVVVIIAPWTGLDLTQSLLAQLALLGATACYGFSLAYMRRFLANSGMSPLAFSFVNIGIAAVIMTIVAPAVALTPVRLDPWIVVSMVLLGCLGTGVAYIWNQNTLRAWGPTAASTVTYITPVVGVALGFLVLGERIGWHEPVGAGIVFLGILLAQNRLRMPQRRPSRGNGNDRRRTEGLRPGANPAGRA